MLSDLFSACENNIIRSDIGKIELVVTSDRFLRGLGKKSKNEVINLDAPIIGDLLEAHSMMTSQEVWDLPEPWPYQYFIGEVEDEAAKFEYGTVALSEERLKWLKIYRFQADTVNKRLMDHLYSVYQKNDINHFLAEIPELGDVDKTQFEFIVNNSLPNEICSYIHYMIEVAIMVGLENTLFFRRMLEIFSLGGLPCGWLGGTKHEDGADPEDCMAMLHFGKLLP